MEEELKKLFTLIELPYEEAKNYTVARNDGSGDYYMMLKNLNTKYDVSNLISLIKSEKVTVIPF